MQRLAGLTFAGVTLPQLAMRVLVGVLTAAVIAVGSLSFKVYEDTASHSKDIAYLLKRDEQVEQAVSELRADLAELKNELTQTNAEFHQAAIGKINELLTRIKRMR